MRAMAAVEVVAEAEEAARLPWPQPCPPMPPCPAAAQVQAPRAGPFRTTGKNSRRVESSGRKRR